MPYRVDFDRVDHAALERLIELGALDAEVQDDGRGAALMPDGVDPDQVARAVGVSDLAISPAAGRDDGSVWALSLRPIRIGSIRLVPAALTGHEHEPGEVRLIDTAAFGTGLHPTTMLCLEIIGDLVQAARPNAILDVGTGSGVLALAALRLGVPQATALDIDDEAVRAAGENARINQLSARLKVVRGSPDQIQGLWPLVVANVLPAPLVEMAPALVRRIGHSGLLVLSGLSTSLRGDVERAYRHRGLYPRDARGRAGWVALVMQASW